jgi:dienelactone hydrolase/lysophospholipase L1-like esterase
MYLRRLPYLALVLAVPAPIVAQTPELPRVVLIGDSIRIGYAPLVAKRLQGKAVVISAKDNGGDSANVLKNLEVWAVQQKADLVHFNCGLHDLKLDKKSQLHQVEPEPYEGNLRRIVARLKGTGTAVVFASTTPIHDERHAKRGAAFDRLEADVRRYNAIAAKVMNEAGAPVHDLHWVVTQAGPDKLLGGDGTHYTPAGNERLADAVADCVLRQLSVSRYRPLPPPASGPKAAAEYRKAEAERDALVPPAYKNLPIGKFQLPTSPASWKEQRPKVLHIVQQSLGELPPRPTPVRARTITRELRAGYILERVGIDNGVDGEIGALLLLPEGPPQPKPAILWLHSSTPDKTQIITPNTNGGAEALGEVLVRAGYVVLAPDAYWHGERAGTGPSGSAETGRTEQESLFKLHLWMGRTLWGMFVRDDQVALDYLCSRPEVDARRIGTTGMSMGSTRAWWLAAVDERIACAVGIACLTRYENLIRHGQLRQHGVYYFVNGLLPHFDSEGVLALIAPRPFLALTGDLDAGSPADGIKVIEEKLSKVYSVLGAAVRFRNILYPEVGHTVTPAMRAETLAWFDRWLR